ncbi:MAG: dTMP kinase [Planctomycetota bacterium]
MNTEGTLIVLCGIDGSGKTAQTEMLCRRLEESERNVQYLEFPRYSEGFFGDLIARYLRGEFAPQAGEIDPYLASLPFACDRWEARPQLERWLEDGATVICNRYVSANLAHQGGKLKSPAERKRFRRWVEKMEYEVFEIPRPDLHVWLDVPAGVALRLIRGKGEREYLAGGEDIHEKDIEHLRTTRGMYKLLALNSSTWCTINCAPDGPMLSRTEIADRVWDAVETVLI